MEFSDEQVRQLKAKLDAKYVKTRHANGSALHYIEGWHVIAEANRIFGFDAWDRRTLSSTCVHSEISGRSHFAAYVAKVRVSVRAGKITIVREGSGMGEAVAPTPGQAHELALKCAETDATKRALATFGNPFGLALYDRDQASVRKSRNERVDANERNFKGPWVLRSANGSPQTIFRQPREFAAALRKAMGDAHDIEVLFVIWEQNVGTVRAINSADAAIAQDLVTHLKTCAVSFTNPKIEQANLPISKHTESRSKIDKSALAISEPKRVRSKEHLRFVARQPCLICGRTPAQAHHIRYAQTRGLGMKMSDEFTVPLCAIQPYRASCNK
jgi:DNA recombination protein Rad52